MAWVKQARSDTSFLVGPEGQIYGDIIEHEAIMIKHFDDFPFAIQEIMSKDDGGGKRNVIRQALDELLKMGWVRGYWTGDGTCLNLETYTEGIIEKALIALPPEMLDVRTLYIDAPNASPAIQVGQGEDALSAFLEDKNLAFAGSIMWDQIKPHMDKLGLTIPQMYTTMGGPDREIDETAMWAWLIQEVEPAEALGFLQYEFGVDIDG